MVSTRQARLIRTGIMGARIAHEWTKDRPGSVIEVSANVHKLVRAAFVRELKARR